jgi:hypothetical protein
MENERFRAVYEYESGEILYDPGDETNSLSDFPNKGDDFRIPGEKMVVVRRGKPRVVPDGDGRVTIVPVICKLAAVT